MDPIILHADLNSFYASVEMLDKPELRDVPMAVAGDIENRHGIILAKNEKAKVYGVRTAETIWQARKKCPGIQLVPPDHDKYHHYSELAREIFCRLTDRVEPFGVDEAWLDVSGSTGLFGDGPAMADQLRRWTREELGLTCSVGVSFTRVFAKLGSDLRKPDATTVISRENYRQVVWPLPVGQLLFVGGKTVSLLNRYGIRTIGDLAVCDQKLLQQWLGQSGPEFWLAANGLSDAEVGRFQDRHEVKSVSNSTTTARDLEDIDSVKLVLYQLSDQVAGRLRAIGLKAKTLQISIRDNTFHTIDRQCRLIPPTNLAADLAPQAMSLFIAHYPWTHPVRNLGVRAADLSDGTDDRQISLDDWRLVSQPDPESGHSSQVSRTSNQTVMPSPDPPLRQRNRQAHLEQTMDKLREKYGDKSVGRGLMVEAPDRVTDSAGSAHAVDSPEKNA